MDFSSWPSPRRKEWREQAMWCSLIDVLGDSLQELSDEARETEVIARAQYLIDVVRQVNRATTAAERRKIVMALIQESWRLRKHEEPPEGLARGIRKAQWRKYSIDSF